MKKFFLGFAVLILLVAGCARAPSGPITTPSPAQEAKVKDTSSSSDVEPTPSPPESAPASTPTSVPTQPTATPTMEPQHKDQLFGQYPCSADGIPVFTSVLFPPHLITGILPMGFVNPHSGHVTPADHLHIHRDVPPEEDSNCIVKSKHTKWSK